MTLKRVTKASGRKLMTSMTRILTGVVLGFFVLVGSLTLGTAANDYFTGKVYFKDAKLVFSDASNMQFSTSTGTKLGTGTTQKIAFHNSTPVVQASALTAQSTTLTHTAPSSDDFAIQDLTNSEGFGFETKDEGNSALKALANLQTRLAAIETLLENKGLVAAN